MSTKKNKKNKKSKTLKNKKLKKHINALQFYPIKVIPPRNLNKYIAKHKLLKKIKTVVLPEIKKQNINYYLVPLPSSNNNHYFHDFVYDYIEKYFNRNYYKENGIILIVYMNHNLTLNTEIPLKIQYILDKNSQQKVCDIFSKHLPNNYKWNGSSKKAMFIHYKQ